MKRLTWKSRIDLRRENEEEKEGAAEGARKDHNKQVQEPGTIFGRRAWIERKFSLGMASGAHFQGVDCWKVNFQ